MILPFLGFRIWGVPAYDMENYFRIRKCIRDNPNEIYAFVCVNKKAVSYFLNHLLTGAKWSHAGFLYLDDEGEVRMRHMLGSGFQDWTLLSYLREVDDFALLTVPVMPEKKDQCKSRLAKIERRHLLVSYDFNFDLSDKLVTILDDETDDRFVGCPLYCSELVWVCCYGLVSDNHVLQPKWRLERSVFEPDDVFVACKKIEV